jgi:hypothetical protein
MQAASLDATLADLAIGPDAPDHVPAGSPPAVRSAAAERMRRHRERRRRDFRCFRVDLHATEIDELIRRELLAAEARKSHRAIVEPSIVISTAR